jgi:hypothetical protein
MNFSGKPVAGLTVTLNGLGAWAKVRSVERGSLQLERRGDAFAVTLPLSGPDMLLLDD